jgi:cysteine sulfinate desulfinase/cysteine desulfurase-like protein
LRLSAGAGTTEDDIQRTVAAMRAVLERMRPGVGERAEVASA